LWGLGHTVSLVIAGIIVVFLRIAIPGHVAFWLELIVALMIIGLGSRILYHLLRSKQHVHIHKHTHGGRMHTHLHFHDTNESHDPTDSQYLEHNSHLTRYVGWRSVTIGMIHGLAGSAALTLLVLTNVVRGGSTTMGIVYLLLFGLGSIVGMVGMSTLIGLPFVFTARKFENINRPIRLLAGITSVAFGIYYALEIIKG
jgi:ABC-type nickel/cobalt efflux system permease component RcnA